MRQNLLLKHFIKYLFFGILPVAAFLTPHGASSMDPLVATPMDLKFEQAEVTITGQVIDENGEGLIGATVTVKGATTGTVTDIDGKYSLTVDESATLVFNYIGYNSVEEVIGGRSVIDVTLTIDDNLLNEVVVTGYQTLTQERITGSFETLSGDILAQRPTMNLQDKLEGIASGVAVNNGKVTVRGQSTIQANADPLYVVDGFPMTGSTLSVNPEDIESITVLKDAAAASIWGVRASNGVIVITTKKGSSKGTQINFSSFIEIQERVDFSKQNWLTTAEEVDMQQEWFDKGWYRALSSELGGHNAFDQIEIANIYLRGMSPDGEVWSQARYDAFIKELKGNDVLRDWERNMLQKRIRKTYNFSISSGGENNSIYASLVYNDNDSYMVGSDDDRVVLNVRDEFRLNDRFIFSAGVNSSIRNSTENGYDPNTVEMLRSYEPLVDEFGRGKQYYRDFDPWVSQEREAMDGYFPYTYSELEEMQNSDITKQIVDIRTQFGIGVNIIEGLRFDSRIQYEIGYINQDNYETMDLPSQRLMVNNFYVPDELDEDGEPLGYQYPIGTKYIYNKNDYHAWDWRNTVSYEKSWDVHDINLFGGTEIRKHQQDSLEGTVYGYDEQGTVYLPVNESEFRSGLIKGWDRSALNQDAFYTMSNDDVREVSFFSNVGYTYQDKYSITASFRIDQKNLFGSDPDFRYKPLWSVGGSWQATKEDFMSSYPIVNRLTVRATYGISGNASNEYSPFAQAYPTVEGWGSKIFNFLELQDPANDQLKWEETATWNFGVDFAVLDNRIWGSIDFYKKKSSDLLGEQPLDPTNGFAFATYNYASMKNKGVDITLNGTIMESNGLKWDARLLFSYNKNRLTDVANENIVATIMAKDGALRVGEPLDNIYSFNYAGLSNFGDVTLNTASSDSPVNWRDYRGNEKEADLIYHGTGTPPVYGGLSTTVNYKGFDLTITTSFKFSYFFKQYTGVGVAGFYYNKRMNSIWRDRWQEAGDELTTRVPKLNYYGTSPISGVDEDWWDNYDADWYWQDSQDFVFEGGMVRVKDIILGYNLPSKLLGNAPIKSARLSVQVTNPFLWVKNDKDIDPETVDLTSENDFWRETLYRRSTAAWTQLKTITFGVRATF
ncbi:MAG: SusC/RagA family TonB-linked outer membrane protein [Cytophagales bacterium]|nr:SusC/RagA family TonB-linked outer membrane protein [Cytophagales bacterium]